MGCKKEVLSILFVVSSLFLLNNIYALGLTPAKAEFNFEPGAEKTVEYQVLNIREGSKIEVTLTGDLTKYATLSKNLLTSEDNEFIVKLKMPDKIETPGKNGLGVRVSERVDPELARGTISTAVAVNGVIYVYVPYPGRYLNVDLKGYDVNVGDPLTFELDLVSKGDEDVTVTPYIEIFASNGSRDLLTFSTRTIKSQEEIDLKKDLNTSSYNPGVYKAVATVDYGLLAQDEVQFRVGELRIDLINYTRQIELDGIKKFQLQVESGWNDAIDGAYADVTFYNSSGFSQSFRTTTSTLTPWENKIIEGYFDTSNFSLGVYDANITLSYFGKNTGKSSSRIVQVEFVKKSAKGFLMWLILISASVFVVCTIILLIRKFSKKNGKRKK